MCHLRGVRMSASKIRRVLDVIRGKSYGMLVMLGLCRTDPANRFSTRCSRARQRENNMGMNKAKLYVSECYADGGATMKRFRPRAQGRPFSIRKRTASITLKMAERELNTGFARVSTRQATSYWQLGGGENDCLRHSAIVAPTADPRSPAFVFVFNDDDILYITFPTTSDRATDATRERRATRISSLWLPAKLTYKSICISRARLVLARARFTTNTPRPRRSHPSRVPRLVARSPSPLSTARTLRTVYQYVPAQNVNSAPAMATFPPIARGVAH